MQSGTVADIAAVVDNCAVALQEAEEMAGFRPSQVVIGIAGELVKGFTTTLTQERKRPEQPIADAELVKLIDQVQREALKEAERSITWETGLPHVDVRLVHSAIVGASIDGYGLTNPVGFQGRHIKIAIFNAFAPLVHLGALQSVASQLDLELLEVVAEPYAVARVLGRGARPPGRRAVRGRGRRHDRRGARPPGRHRGDADVRARRPGVHQVHRRPPRPPFPRAESLKVDYARGLVDPRARRRSREIVGEDVAVWAAGVELVHGGAGRRRACCRSRIYVCGGGSRLPEIRRRAGRGARSGSGCRSRARRRSRSWPGPGRGDHRRDGPARGPAGRDAARPRVPGDRDPDLRGPAGRRAAPRAARDEGLGSAVATVVYLDAEDEITSAAARIRAAADTRVAVVVPFGSRVATSRINFRLLAREAMVNGKRLDIVAPDASARALAASAGIPVFASVGEYEAALNAPEDDDATTVAPAGDQGRAAGAGAAGAAGRRQAWRAAGRPRRRRPDPRRAPRPRPTPRPAPPMDPEQEAELEEVVRRSRQIPVVKPRRRVRKGLLATLLVLIVGGGAAAVAGYLFLPAADITITPQIQPVGPISSRSPPIPPPPPWTPRRSSSPRRPSRSRSR